MRNSHGNGLIDSFQLLSASILLYSGFKFLEESEELIRLHAQLDSGEGKYMIDRHTKITKNSRQEVSLLGKNKVDAQFTISPKLLHLDL